MAGKKSTVLDRSVRVEFGNPQAHRCLTDPNARVQGHDHALLERDAPSVTYLSIPPGYTVDADANVAEIGLHLARSVSGITRLPDNEAFLVATHPRDGMWGHHGAESPSWVASDHAGLGGLLAAFYDCELYDLGDDDFHRFKEDTHHTIFGGPGVGPQAGPLAPRALKVNAGNDIQSALLGGGQVDDTGQLTGATATTATKSGATWTTNQWAGCRVYATVSATQMVWGLVVSNTATVLTVDRWYTVATPGGAAGTTPSTTGTYVIVGAGGPAAWFMGLTATATAPSATDTALTGEITTAGLTRKICPYAHTAGAASYTLTPVFTAQAADVPVTVAQIGVFNSMVVADTTSTMLFRTLLNATATLSATGDQLTVTETVSE